MNQPNLYLPYIYHILLHEYLHALGIIDEQITKKYVYLISKELFGENHVVTEIAKNFSSFIRNLIYPTYGYLPPTEFKIELVQGFDRSSVTYIR